MDQLAFPLLFQQKIYNFGEITMLGVETTNRQPVLELYLCYYVFYYATVKLEINPESVVQSEYLEDDSNIVVHLTLNS